MKDEMDYGTHDGRETPQRGANDRGKLTHIVERLRSINAEVKGLKMEAKEIEDGAWEACGYSAKAVRQLAKEAAWDAVERERRRQLEEEIDNGRAALGFLADTPLGEAELQRMQEEQRAPDYGAAKSRGGPKGSRNKPKAAA